jgi:hypothetical protein
MAEDRRYAQFMGGMIQSVLPLIYRKDQEGNTITGCLHIPAVVGMLGKDSFHHPPTSPWETLLLATRPTSNLKSSLQYTWLHLTQNFQDVAAALKTSDKKPITEPECGMCGILCRWNSCTIDHKCTNPGDGDMMITLFRGEDNSNIKQWQI